MKILLFLITFFTPLKEYYLQPSDWSIHECITFSDGHTECNQIGNVDKDLKFVIDTYSYHKLQITIKEDDCYTVRDSDIIFGRFCEVRDNWFKLTLR